MDFFSWLNIFISLKSIPWSCNDEYTSSASRSPSLKRGWARCRWSVFIVTWSRNWFLKRWKCLIIRKNPFGTFAVKKNGLIINGIGWTQKKTTGYPYLFSKICDWKRNGKNAKTEHEEANVNIIGAQVVIWWMYPLKTWKHIQRQHIQSLTRILLVKDLKEWNCNNFNLLTLKK